MYQIQSILFDKDLYTIEQAIKFLKKHNFVHNKIDIKDQYIRFRQIDPDIIKKIGFKKFMTKEINKGIKFIIGYKE